MKLMKRGIFVLAALVTGVGLIYGVENWLGARSYRKALEELEAKGESTQYADLVPDPVNEAENFGSAPYLQGLRRKAEPGSVQAELEELYDSLRDLHEAETPEEYGEIAERLSKLSESGQGDSREFLEEKFSLWHPVRSELVARLDLPQARWNRSFPRGSRGDTYWVYQASTFSLMKLIALEALFLVHEGSAEIALENIEIGWRLGSLYSEEPGMIYHVILLANLALMSESVVAGLQAGIWSDEQLDRLDEGLGRLNFREVFLRSLRGERAYGISFVEELGRFGKVEEFVTRDDPWWLAVLPRGWGLRGVAETARAFQSGIEIFESVDVPFGEQMAQWEEILRGQESESWRAWTARLTGMKMSGVGRACLEAAQKNAILRAAIGVLRFELEHGRYPERLDGLGVPVVDPANDQALIYRRAGDGFRIETNEEQKEARLAFERLH